MSAEATRKKVYVGMSGGVDSSVSAALLKREGYDVTGVFIKVWQPDWIVCNWKEERLDAMRAAAHLDIPFITLDLEKEYKNEVIDYMIAEYARGRTPNPDVMCNRHVKFGAFWKWARERGADYIATGHYARVRSKEQGAGRKEMADRRWEKGKKSSLKLLAGVDTNKDQSYFLWTLNQDDLAHVLFPVGGYEKSDVRRLARKFKLPNADKKDSQGLCFIGKVDLKEFLSHYAESRDGKVLDEHGETVGTHPGALFFTIGERHGFSVRTKTPHDQPQYVIDKDMARNTITVSNRTEHLPASGLQKTTRISEVNWVAGRIPETLIVLEARSRYRQSLKGVRIVSFGIAETVIEFEKPEDMLTPGQSLVIYAGDECLGGGVIV